MIDSLNGNPLRAPVAVILLPFAYAMHVAEEWFGGFVDWASLTLGIDIGAQRFIAINTIGLVLFVIGAALAYRERHAAWIGVSLAALVGLNAVAHAVLSVTLGAYSPGVITGLLLYVPLSLIIIRWAANHLSHGVVAGAILFGIGIHVVVTLAAAL